MIDPNKTNKPRSGGKKNPPATMKGAGDWNTGSSSRGKGSRGSGSLSGNGAKNLLGAVGREAVSAVPGVAGAIGEEMVRNTLTGGGVGSVIASGVTFLASCLITAKAPAKAKNLRAVAEGAKLGAGKDLAGGLLKSVGVTSLSGVEYVNDGLAGVEYIDNSYLSGVEPVNMSGVMPVEPVAVAGVYGGHDDYVIAGNRDVCDNMIDSVR